MQQGPAAWPDAPIGCALPCPRRPRGPAAARVAARRICGSCTTWRANSSTASPRTARACPWSAKPCCSARPRTMWARPCTTPSSAAPAAHTGPPGGTAPRARLHRGSVPLRRHARHLDGARRQRRGTAGEHRRQGVEGQAGARTGGPPGRPDRAGRGHRAVGRVPRSGRVARPDRRRRRPAAGLQAAFPVWPVRRSRRGPRRRLSPGGPPARRGTPGPCASPAVRSAAAGVCGGRPWRRRPTAGGSPPRP